jgi:arylsulfatase
MKEKSYLLPILAPQLIRFGKSLEEFPPRQKGSGIGAATLLNQKKD